MRQGKRILAVALIVCVIMTMSGCRYSKTLEQIIYNQYREGMIDIAAPFEYAENDLDNEQKSNDLNDIEQQDDADRTTQQVVEGIVEEKDEPDTQDGYKVSFIDQNGETDADVDRARNSANADSQVQETDQGGTPHSDENSQSTGNTSPTITDDTGKDGVTGNGGEDPVADPNANTNKNVADPSGEQQEPPENVRTVAAVGELAAIFVILDCEEKLVATDAETAEKAQNIPAFAGLSDAEALWEADGLSGLGNTGFNRLMELKPDLIVEVSGSNTFSDAQIAKLKENGSEYQIVSAMTNVQNVENAVLALGQMLGAEQRAETYVEWTENTLKDIKRLSNGAKNYTLYIDGWDTGAAISASGTVLENGCAVVNGWNYEPTQTISTFLSYAGVTNASSLSQYPSKERGYFLPMELQSGITFNISGGTLATYTYSRIYSWLSKTYLSELPYSLGGGPAYKYILAADQETASAIQESKDRINGMWSIYTEAFQNQQGTFTGQGGYNMGSDMVISHIAVAGSYDILTNPEGYSSWTQGGTESILETVWAACRISDAIDEGTMEEYIRSFYSTFYDCNLSNEEMTLILEGN